MDGMLKTGEELVSESSSRYRVVSFLGAGGQGEVYDVETCGRHHALKWYFPYMATKAQKTLLEKLIADGSPDGKFLWPQDIVSRNGELGYVMPLRAKNYKSCIDLMKRRAEPSFYTLCRAAYNLTNGYEKLHGRGYSYRDISFSNVFFDPDSGDVLICDNDNVSPNDKDDSAVYGTPRFMAPEIVTGRAWPSRNTDLYSLAVLLFYMFMISHPLEGRQEMEIHCMDMHAMNRLYGTDPVFVYDPVNKMNRPVKGYHDNVLIYWELYPQSIRQLFTKSFTDGLTSPNRRVTERQWMDAIANLISGIMICPACGAEVFYDEVRASRGAAHTCWNCSRALQSPLLLRVGKNHVVLRPGEKIRSHAIRGDYDMDTPVGEVEKNPNNPSLWGIRNDTNENWTYIRADGQQVPVETGKRAAIAKGAKISFGQAVGEFE